MLWNSNTVFYHIFLWTNLTMWISFVLGAWSIHYSAIIIFCQLHWNIFQKINSLLNHLFKKEILYEKVTYKWWFMIWLMIDKSWGKFCNSPHHISQNCEFYLSNRKVLIFNALHLEWFDMHWNILYKYLFVYM